MNIERAIFKIEILIVLGEHLWEYAFFQPIRWLGLIISVHEYIPTSRMTVEITEEEYVS
jgi:hypothetical protein